MLYRSPKRYVSLASQGLIYMTKQGNREMESLDRKMRARADEFARRELPIGLNGNELARGSSDRC